MTTTSTTATLEVSQDTYNEIRAKLEKAGYDHALTIPGKVNLHGLALTPEKPRKRRKTQLKFPLHLGTDAQGPMSIHDKSGRAVAWFTDVHEPTRGYAWKPQDAPASDPDASKGITHFPERNAVVRAVLAAINKFYEV